MKKKRYYCHKCKKSLKTSVGSKQHFDKYPTHRTEKQQQKRLSNTRASGVKKKRRAGTLPTVAVKRRRTMAHVDKITKYCTQCGLRHKAEHRFCGQCGERVA